MYCWKRSSLAAIRTALGQVELATWSPARQVKIFTISQSPMQTLTMNRPHRELYPRVATWSFVSRICDYNVLQLFFIVLYIYLYFSYVLYSCLRSIIYPFQSNNVAENYISHSYVFAHYFFRCSSSKRSNNCYNYDSLLYSNFFFSDLLSVFGTVLNILSKILAFFIRISSVLHGYPYLFE